MDQEDQIMNLLGWKRILASETHFEKNTNLGKKLRASTYC